MSRQAEFDAKVRLFCLAFDGSETSGIRSPDRNALVGGVPGSRHMLANGGMARDIVLDDRSPAWLEPALRVANNLFDYVEDEGDHIHLHDNP